MCIVIVACRNLVLTIGNVAAIICLLYSILSPKWLIGPTPPEVTSNVTELYNVSTMGLWNRCIQVNNTDVCGPFSKDDFSANNDDYFPYIWKVSSCLMFFGVSILFVSMLILVIDWCARAAMRKVRYGIVGFIHTVSGLSLIVGLILYLGDFSNTRAKDLCGPDVKNVFSMANCTLGWMAGVGIIGTVLVIGMIFVNVRVECQSKGRF